MKKLFAVLVALTLVLTMGTMAMAATTGTITINNAVVGENYTVYKMFDFAPVAGSANQGRYTVVAEWEDFLEGAGAAYLKTNAETGTIEWVGETSDVRKAELAKAAIAYADEKNNATAGTIKGTTLTAATSTVTFEGLALGYYAIDTSLGNICALTNTNSTYLTFEKNTQPTIEKKIDENGTLVDANNVAIGDTVNYQATVTTGKGTVNYVIHDKMSAGLTFNSGSVVVTYNGNKLEAGENKDYVFTYATNENPLADGCTFEINFTDAFEKNLVENKNIVVTYSATLNDEAVIGSTGNPNEISLKYGDAQETTKDYVITYTTKLTINKKDMKGDPLKGAGFTLYKGSVADANKVGNEIAGGDITEFVWEGLEAGTYVLVETTVPNGYNKAEDITFTITWEAPDEAITSGDEQATWTDDSDKINVENGVFSGTVVNNTGALLPETGGIGTTIFYVVGGLLMAAALIVLVSKKRMASFA